MAGAATRVPTSALPLELLINSLRDTVFPNGIILVARAAEMEAELGVPDDFNNFMRWLRGEPVTYDPRLGKYVGTHSLQASPPQPGAAQPDANRVEERLDYVNRLLADKRISQEEAATARAAILRDLT